MNYVVVAMMVLTVVPIVFGALLGLLRGSRRALLRLILILVSIVLAFVLVGTISNTVMNIEITVEDGETIIMQTYLKDMLMNNLSEDLATSISDYATSIVQGFMQVIIFLAVFFALWFLTWLIVFPIFKIFIKKGEKPRRLLGMLIGVVQGVIVALCVGLVFNGLIVQTNKIVNAVSDVSGTIGEMQATRNDDGIMILSEEPDAGHGDDEGYTHPDGEQTSDGGFLAAVGDFTPMIEEYINSPLGKIYNSSIGTKPFEYITTVKLSDESKVTLSQQVDSVCTIAKDLVNLAKEIKGLQDFDFSNLLEATSIEQLQAILDKIGGAMDALSDETKEIIDAVIDSFAGNLGIDMGDVKLTDVNFHEEGQIIGELYKYSQKEHFEPEDADAIVEQLAQSKLVLGILGNENLDVSSNIDDQQKQLVSAKIDELEAGNSLSAAKIEALRNIFGLNETADAE